MCHYFWYYIEILDLRERLNKQSSMVWNPGRRLEDGGGGVSLSPFLLFLKEILNEVSR